MFYYIFIYIIYYINLEQVTICVVTGRHSASIPTWPVHFAINTIRSTAYTDSLSFSLWSYYFLLSSHARIRHLPWMPPLHASRCLAISLLKILSNSHFSIVFSTLSFNVLHGLSTHVFLSKLTNLHSNRLRVMN